jgi:hypothetical protein
MDKPPYFHSIPMISLVYGKLTITIGYNGNDNNNYWNAGSGSWIAGSKDTKDDKKEEITQIYSWNGEQVD